MLASPGVSVKADVTPCVACAARFRGAPRDERCALLPDRRDAASIHALDDNATPGVRVPIRSAVEEWWVIADHPVSIWHLLHL